MRDATIVGLWLVLILLAANGKADGAGNLDDGPDANLIYNYLTGHVSLDAADVPPGFMSFAVDNGLVNDFRIDDPLQYAETYFPNRPAASALDIIERSRVSYVELAPHDIVTVNLGDIFPIGFRTSLELSDYLEEASYESASGDVGELDLLIVPEPSSLALAICCLCAMPRRVIRRQPATRVQRNRTPGPL